MNTRLQVEHPGHGDDHRPGPGGVAAPRGGRRAAAAAPGRARDRGHAIEVRLYAEDPARDYMPGTGTLPHLRTPAEGPHVRVDTGVRAGDAITVHYDPMIAKLIVWDETRAAAMRRLRAALRDYEVAGVQTNLELLRAIAAHPAFLAAELDTGFLGRHPEVLPPAGSRPRRSPPPPTPRPPAARARRRPALALGAAQRLAPERRRAPGPRRCTTATRIPCAASPPPRCQLLDGRAAHACRRRRCCSTAPASRPVVATAGDPCALAAPAARRSTRCAARGAPPTGCSPPCPAASSAWRPRRAPR